MGLVGSISSTQVESFDDSRDTHEDRNAVAKPLKPAYAPNPPQDTGPPVINSLPFTWHRQDQHHQQHQHHQHQLSIFYNHSHPFVNPSFPIVEETQDLPDAFSCDVNQTISSDPSLSLPFQSGHPPVQSLDTSATTNGTHLGYYPLEMGSVRATGVILSRAVRMLEATPPTYLLMPEHPNIPPPTPLYGVPSGPPPAPPNTAHAQRFNPSVHQYPSVNKTPSSRDLSSDTGARIESQRLGQSRPPTFG